MKTLLFSLYSIRNSFRSFLSMRRTFKLVFHIVIAVLLTILTQVGGLLWISVFTFFKFQKKSYSKRYRLAIFVTCYLLVSLVLVPILVSWTGRVALPVMSTSNLRPHNYMTVLLNRHYVKATLRDNLIKTAQEIKEQHSSLYLSYLDANFPFIDGFPLLPHLSHNDGKKVDLTFYYTKKEKVTNLKPSRTGYGAFVEPENREYDQAKSCLQAGYWQYDYPKYFTLGSRKDLFFDEITTKNLIVSLLSKQGSQKLFIEPHLKNRLGLKNSKIRFQGCGSVRHDDHIHYQIN